MRLFYIFIALVAHGVHAICIREYFAQPVIYDKAMNIDFYYTGINMATVTACAEFCADRHFCRTAVFNSFTKTCAISYEYTLNCRYNPTRYKEFPVDQASSHLIQIACIEKCNEKSKNIAFDAPSLPTLLTAEPFDSLPKTLKKVELITGKPDEAASTDYVELARARDPPKKVNEEEGFVNHLIIENVTGVLAAHDAVNKQVAGGSKICYREIPQKYLLGGSFERHDQKTIQECRCLCAATYNSGNLQICQSFQWYTSGVCVLNKGNHLGKYDLIKDKYATYQYVDCDEEVLLDIAAKVCGKGQTIRAPILRSPIKETSKETFKLPVLAPSPFDPITGKIKKNYENTLKETTTSPLEIETQSSVRTSTPVVSTSTQTTTTTTETTTTTTTATATSTTAQTTSESATTPEVKEIEASGVEPEEPNGPLNEIESNLIESRESSNEAQKGTENTSIVSSKNKLPISSTRDGCFERIDGYMMVNVAGGLEHDVSIEECQCICANSLNSGRYSFECASATYYHNERDCILNLENRNENENLFEKQFEDYNVTYVGMICPRDEAIKEVINPNHEFGCKAQTTRPASSSSNAVNQEDNSDSCYREMQFYVLEGTAQQIETGVSLQQCKCLCTQSEHRYGEPCQSFQYYFESQTCLLSKYNRFSNPENFNFVQTSQKRSYFELICATDETQLKRYTAKECQIDDALRNQLIRESENEIFFVDKSTTTEAPTTAIQSTVPVTEKKLKVDHETNLGDVEKVDSSTEIARNAVRKVSAEVGEDEDQEERLTVISPAAKNETSEKQETVEQISEKSATDEKKTEADDEAEDEKLVAESPDAAGIASDSTTNLGKLEKEKEQNEEESTESKQNDEEVLLNNEENREEGEAGEEVDDQRSKSETETKESVKKTVNRRKALRNVKRKKLLEDEKKAEVKTKKVWNRKKVVEDEERENEDSGDDTSNEDSATEQSAEATEETAEATTSEAPTTDDDVATASTESTATASSTTVNNSAEDNVTSSVTITTTSKPQRTPKPEVKKRKVFINRNIPETEGLREKDFEYDDVQVEMSGETEATTIHTAAPVEKKHKNIPLDDVQLPEKNSKLMAILKKAHGVKTRKFTEKSEKARELEVSAQTESTEAVETSTFITTTTATYPKFDKCTYSALYQTAFQGRRLLKAVHVKTASDCFAACYALRCRSANLISQGEINLCELYKDSLIDYRRPDMIGFEGSSVYFDGIRCEA